MSSYISQILSVRTKTVLLCVVLVFAIASYVSAGGKKDSAPAAGASYELAKVYLVDKGPTVGDSGDFWEGLTGIVVDRRPWEGTASDATGIFYLAADEKNLYIRAEIKDCAPQLRPADMDASVSWNGTSLQVFFGTKTSRHATYEDGDSGLSFWVVPGTGDEGPYKVQVSKGRVLNERQYKAAVVEWVKDTSYIIEASFPLDILGIAKPFKVGQKVRAEFRINHAKHDEDRTVIVNWRTSTDDAWQNPTVWSDGEVVTRP